MKSLSVVVVCLPVLLAIAAYHQQEQLPPRLADVVKIIEANGLQAWQQLSLRLRPTNTTLESTHEKEAAPPAAETSASQSMQQLADTTDSGSCQIQGIVDDLSDCTYSSVHKLNTQHVYPTVSQLVRTAFFRYFKVNIYCDCPLWPDDSMCSLRACSVCECAEHEVPAPWLAAEKQAATACKAAEKPDCSTNDCALEMEGHVNRHVDPVIQQQLLKHSRGWRGINNPWMAEGEDDEEFQYINLVVNPERYTGYKGEHAHRIWDAIYQQSCFTDGVSCSEERVFYRLISGMHASISCHLAADYLLDEQQGIWGPNLTEFRNRLGTPETRDRVQNLYFAYLFVLRAVMKAAPLLTSYDYNTGLPEEDVQTRQLITQMLSNPAITESCPMPFDEGRLWKGEGALELKKQLQLTFQNITRVMDCVGCEKCKLWGKLQTLGIATALKILFSSRDCTGLAPDSQELPFGDELELERNEVIALINLLGRFSNSVENYHRLTAELERQQGVTPSIVEKAAVV